MCNFIHVLIELTFQIVFNNEIDIISLKYDSIYYVWPGSLLEPSEGAFELTYESACIIGNLGCGIV